MQQLQIGDFWQDGSVKAKGKGKGKSKSKEHNQKVASAGTCVSVVSLHFCFSCFFSQSFT